VICASVVAFPLIYDFSKLGGGVTRFIDSMFIFTCVLFTMFSLHFKRTSLLLFNYDIDKDLQIIKRVAVRPEKAHTLTSSVEAPSEKRYGISSKNPFDAVKSKNLITRRQVCKEQMTHWSKVLRHTEAMMLVTFEDTNLNRPDAPARGAIYPTSVPVSSTDPC
jgi:hypothetical protein